MKRRIITLIMASILALSAAACSNASGGESKVSTDASAASAASVVSESSNEAGADSTDQQSAQADSKTASLEYWTEDSPAMKSIMEYVSSVTDEKSDKFVPEAERIAVFDSDGTLYGELFPTYFDQCVMIHRLAHDDTYKGNDEDAAYCKALEEYLLNGGEKPKAPRSSGDIILAGNTLGAGAIAAVAIGLPCYGMFLALMNAIIHGTSLRVTWAKGRADQEEFQRAFSGGLTFAGISGLLFMTIVIVLSVPMTAAFGGAKATTEISDYALLYLRCCAPMIFLSAISGCVRECIGVLGYQTERASLGIINMVCNLVISIIFVMLLPKEIKMAGLGIGSSAAALIEFIIGIVIIKLRKNRVGGCPLVEQPTSHTTVRTVRYTAVQ